MKRLVNLRTVLDGLRSSVSTPEKKEAEVEENLKSDNFRVCKTVRHGFPYQPTCVAYDPIQRILAIGTKSGCLRIFGQPGVDFCRKHESDAAVIQIMFLVNEGALITVCSDDTLHLWNFRQKKPEIVHSIKFQRERVTHCHLPFQSKWLFIGTERGNIHMVNIESFTVSGYIINWNKAIDLLCKTHPGPVIHLSDNPTDSNKILIGYESGTVVLWDLRSKSAECRYSSTEALRSISWHHEGKQFMCSHSDGSLSTWNIRVPQKPQTVILPHAKYGRDGKPEPCKPITAVEWKSVRNGDPLVIFSGGMSYDRAGRTPSITIMNGRSTTVLEMEYNVVDFVVLCESPWLNDFQEPYAVVVLLQNDLVVVDLTSSGYPCFENPYPMDIHESPVTTCFYFANCPHDLIPAYYSVGSKQKRTGFSNKHWPVKGGTWKCGSCSYPEVIITGHADGSLKFWDASSVTLQVLYKLKTAKIFEKPRGSKCGEQDDDPFAIQHIYLCAESRILCVTGATHVVLFRFSKQESTIEVPYLDITVLYEVYDDLDSPEFDYPKPNVNVTTQHSSSVGSYSSNTSDTNKTAHQQAPESVTTLKVRQEPRRWSVGYQPDLVCCLTWVDGEPPGNIATVSLNSTYGLLTFGNDSGLAIVDFIQKTCLFSCGTPDIYGSMDPYSRAPRSPRGKRPQGLESVSQTYFSEEIRSPTGEQSKVSVVEHTKLKKTPSYTFKDTPVKVTPVEDTPVKDTSINDTTYIEICHDELEFDNISISDIDILNINNTHKLANSWNCSRKDVCEGNTDDAPSSAPPIAPPRTKKKAKTKCGTAGVTPSTKTVNKPMASDPEYMNSPLRRSASNPEVCINPECEQNDIVIEMPKDKKHYYSFKDRVCGRLKTHHAGLNENGRNKRKITAENNDVENHVHETKARDSESVSKTPIGKHMNLQQSASDGSLRLSGDGKKSHHNDTDCKQVYFGDGDVRSDVVGDGDHTDGSAKGFLRKMSTKLRSLGSKVTSDEDSHPKPRRRVSRDQIKVEIVDLSMDDVKEVPPVKVIPLSQLPNYLRPSDKNDSVNFSRSRSSSMSSLENVSKEAIQCLVFADAYTRKTDNFTAPCLWVGTSLGSVLVIVLNLPPDSDQRLSQPVIVSPSGTIFRLKGAILTMSFLNCHGDLIPSQSSVWRDVNKEALNDKRDKIQNKQMANKYRISPSQSTEVCDRQFAIICSEKQARVMSLPSQTCAYKVKITETSFVAKAEIVEIKDSVCLSCYVGNGHMMVFSLPSLRLLLDVDFLPLTDYRIAKTFCFSNNGHALYFCSPTEIQKLAFSTEICDSLPEMLGDLFLPCETPEAPKQSFFKNLFLGGASTLDREELFGEASGKASKGLTRHIPGSGGMQQLQSQSTGALSDIQRARLALNERGERVSELDDSTARMANQAETFSNQAHHLMMKYRDKKWYQF